MSETTERLKKRARKAYSEFLDATKHLDCGNNLAVHISGDANSAALEFNRIMDKLAEIDPNCPKARLP